ncbi:uncharacterized protein V3H82_014762 isoform 3-T3 [Fundulus diaphanus]
MDRSEDQNTESAAERVSEVTEEPMEEDPGDQAGGVPSDSPPRDIRGAKEFPEEPTAMATADQPEVKKHCKESIDQPGCCPNSEPEDNRKYLMECSMCNIKFAPSVKFDQREVNISLHKEKGDDQNPFFTERLSCTKQDEAKPLKATYNNCEHNLCYKYVTGNNNKGGFDIKLSIEKREIDTNPPHDPNRDGRARKLLAGRTSKDNSRGYTSEFDIQKEDGSKDAQPAQHEHSGSESDTGNWLSRRFFSRTPTWDTVKVKVHFISHQETFGAADAIKKKLKSNMGSSLQEEERRKECNMIVVFCPVTPRVESDINSMMEATADLSSGKPVILVVMHHTRHPDYSTGPYDPRETWKNVVHYVHVLYHETTKGLLKCSENDQAINGIQQFLLKKQQFV